jgi:hypothetical protein
MLSQGMSQERGAIRTGGTFLLGLELAFLVAASQIRLKAQEARPAVTASSEHHKVLPESTRRVVFDSAAFVGETTALPQWDKGYLVSRETLTYQAGVPNVKLFGESGQKVREAAIWFPESQRVVIHSAAVTSDGRIIAAGHAEKADGTAGSFIALTDLSGKMTNVIQTKGYDPSNICQAPDGTVWTFGGTGYDRETGANPGDTLRHFDFQQGQVGSYLPRSTFPRLPMPDVPADIRCLADKVLVYSHGAQEYIEMQYSGDTPHLYPAKAPSEVRLTGFAVTGGGDVYGFFSHAGKGGLYCLSFNAAAKTVRWLPVEGTVGLLTKPGAISGLWGSDGDNLVVGRSGDSAGDYALHWAAPVNR